MTTLEHSPSSSLFNRLKSVVVGTFKIFLDPDTSPRCAAAAFFGFLSFFPAIATVALIYGIFANGPLVAGTVSSLQYILPGMALDILDEQLKTLAAAFSIYVQNWGNYNATFGSVAGAVVLMLWMYNSAQVLVLGAAFNAVLERHSTSRGR